MSISSTRIGKPVLMIDVQASKDKHTSRGVDREKFSMFEKIVSKTVNTYKEGDC